MLRYNSHNKQNKQYKQTIIMSIFTIMSDSVSSSYNFFKVDNGVDSNVE